MSDIYWDNVPLLLHCDGANGTATVTNEKGGTLSVAGTAVLSTAASKFGGSSLLFDGGGHVKASGMPLIGTQDFTIEFFCNPTEWGARYIVAMDADNFVSLFSNSSMEAYFGGGYAKGPATTMLSVWRHVAVERHAGVLNVYIDGVPGTSGNSTGAINFSDIYIGARDSVTTAAQLIGNLDEVRVTVGVARYKGAFTPPTEAFAGAPNLYHVSGVVKDSAGATLASKPVFALSRKDFSILARTQSDSQGGFSLTFIDHPSQVVVIGLGCELTASAQPPYYTLGAPTEQATVLDYITPVLSNQGGGGGGAAA